MPQTVTLEYLHLHRTGQLVVVGQLVVCMVLAEKEEISLTGQQGGVEAQLAALVAWRVELAMEGLSLELPLFSRIASMSAPRSYHG